MAVFEENTRIELVISPSQLSGASPAANDVAKFVAASPPVIPRPIAISAMGVHVCCPFPACLHICDMRVLKVSFMACLPLFD